MINGTLYRDMIISAANSIENIKEEINSLNIFPVPDGDTGINMSLTMQAGKVAMLEFSGNLSECSEKVAGALLRGGRGNSGVILSLFFRGISKEFKGKEVADNISLANAFRQGVESAYKAVRQPTEGTILTVMRMCTETAENLAFDSIDLNEFFEKIVESAKITLAKTPEMLPVLKQANVVDAGGKGFLTILEGMKSVLCENSIIQARETQQNEAQADFQDFNTADIKFAYCTECIIDKDPESNMPEESVECLKTFIMNIGDSGVFIDDTDFIKFHIHTNEPGKVLSESLKYGILAKVKIENMKAQHTSIAEAAKQEQKSSLKAKTLKRAKAEKKYGFVTIAAGDGICDVFKDLGTDCVVEGGQTMNPSTDDIVNAVNATPAEVVFVLPNNKNIYMAAKQAEELVKDKQVIVLKTVSIPQGISAMLSFNEDCDVSENKENMKVAMKSVKTEKMTFAARNSVFENSEIHEGQILGLVEDKVTFIEDDKAECMRKLAEQIMDSSFITIFYGADVSDVEAEKMADVIKCTVGEDKEVNIIPGGQPVYYYIISAE